MTKDAEQKEQQAIRRELCSFWPEGRMNVKELGEMIQKLKRRLYQKARAQVGAPSPHFIVT
eukprot:2618610-Pyramimonas_sp.AAC.1